MKILTIIAFLVIFVMGALSTAIYADMQKSPSSSLMPFSTGSDEVASPKDRIREDQIKVYDDRVVIDITNPEWATFTDTNSMDPVIDAGTNAIEIVPKSQDDVKVGDIVSYKSQYASGTIIHRVAYKGIDNDGVYFVMKGDNNPTSDPGKVRFDQIQRVVVAIIY